MASSERLVPHLVDDFRKGSVSLIIGAGVSLDAGIPTWDALVRKVWTSTIGDGKSRPGFLDGLPDAGDHPLVLQIALEELESRIRPAGKDLSDPIGDGRRALAEKIRRSLYAELAPNPGPTLESLVEFLREDQKRPIRRIARIVSFNADDLIEELANRGHKLMIDPVVWPISRASYHPRRGSCANGLPPIPIYHIHGYLPRIEHVGRESPDALVFTDLQYWDSVATPNSFANRVFTNAIHDSHCVFIGLSMRDLNLMRWLSIHASEVYKDKASEFFGKGKKPSAAMKRAGTALRRHYWIRKEPADRYDLVGRHLYRRGVFSVFVENWAGAFRNLLAKCLGTDTA